LHHLAGAVRKAFIHAYRLRQTRGRPTGGPAGRRGEPWFVVVTADEEIRSAGRRGACPVPSYAGGRGRPSGPAPRPPARVGVIPALARSVGRGRCSAPGGRRTEGVKGRVLGLSAS